MKICGQSGPAASGQVAGAPRMRGADMIWYETRRTDDTPLSGDRYRGIRGGAPRIAFYRSNTTSSSSSASGTASGTYTPTACVCTIVSQHGPLRASAK